MKFEEVNKTLSFNEVQEEVKRCLKCPRPSCKNNGCPAHLRINEFMKAMMDGNEVLAYEIIKDGTNLPLICSRVCDYDIQCRKGCILNFKHVPITPGLIERYIADKHAGIDEDYKVLTSFKRVALIGSGPSSLSAAIELAKNGIKSVVFEKEKYLGGVLSYGIPEYRLPIEVLNKQIDICKKYGIEFITSWNEDINDLFDFDHIIYATGLTSYHMMGISGEDLSGVIDGGEFLKKTNYKIKYNDGEGITLNGITVVVGAGNVAMDCARMAVRLGSKVKVVYRRSEEEAPAARSEIEDAKREGVEFFFLTNPVELIGEDGKLKAIKLEKMTLGELDASNRRSPVPTGEFETIDADYFIEAIGQKSNVDLANKLSLPIERNLVKVDENYFAKGSISAIGDIVHGAKTVVQAMVDGKIAAQKIIEKLEKA